MMSKLSLFLALALSLMLCQRTSAQEVVGFPPEVIEPSEPRVVHRTVGDPSRFFLDFDVGALFPEIRTRIRGDNAFGGRSSDFDLNANASLGISAGFKFGDANAIFASYRNFATDGHPGDDGSVFEVRTRLDINDVSLSYQRQILLPWDRHRWAIEAGARLSTIYYDLTESMQLDPAVTVPVGQGQISLHGSNHFVGAGPTIGVANDFLLIPGLTWFGRTDFAALFGHQTFRFNANSPFIDSFNDSRGSSNTVKVLRLSTGLSWSPECTPHMLFQFGYQFEYWWDIGTFADSHDDLMFNGLFARLRLTY
jgi:Legionella pneumophila major outer membrane protein precursor